MLFFLTPYSSATLFFVLFTFFNFLQSFIFSCYRNVYSFHLSHLFRRISLFMEDTNFDFGCLNIISSLFLRLIFLNFVFNLIILTQSDPTFSLPILSRANYGIYKMMLYDKFVSCNYADMGLYFCQLFELRKLQNSRTSEM